MSLTSGSFRWYTSGYKGIIDSSIDLLSNDLKVILCSSSYTPNPTTHTTYETHISNELPTANGYSLGGQALVGKLLDNTTANLTIFKSDNPLWTISSGNLVARTWILYNNTPSSGKTLICYGSLNYNGGSPIDVSSNVSLSLLFSSGIFQLTAAGNP